MTYLNAVSALPNDVDDQPFGGQATPAALLYYSPDRGGVHPEKHLADYSGIMQADAYAGFNGLYGAGSQAGSHHSGCSARHQIGSEPREEIFQNPLAVLAAFGYMTSYWPIYWPCRDRPAFAPFA